MHDIETMADGFGSVPRIRGLFLAGCVTLCGLSFLPPGARAQVGTLGAGALITESNVSPVGELYLGAPLLHGFRLYGIGSWTDDSWAPTLITAVERVVLPTSHSFTTLGAGAVWLEFKDYEPDFILTSTTVVPLPFAPSVAFVFVGSTQPFTDFEWTIVTKLAVTLFFKE